MKETSEKSEEWGNRTDTTDPSSTEEPCEMKSPKERLLVIAELRGVLSQFQTQMNDVRPFGGVIALAPQHISWLLLSLVCLFLTQGFMCIPELTV